MKKVSAPPWQSERQTAAERLKIELFFKWIKQNLKIKTFLGTSDNAVLTQGCRVRVPGADLLGVCVKDRSLMQQILRLTTGFVRAARPQKPIQTAETRDSRNWRCFRNYGTAVYSISFELIKGAKK
jgi:hypothetical protein